MIHTVIDRETLTLTFERHLRATSEEVFDAWTLPEEIAEWWDPTGVSLVKCAIDLRPGGAFTFENAGHSPPFAGVYTVIERPRKLAFEVMGSTGTVLLTETGGTTRMQVTIRCGSIVALEQFIEMGVASNTEKTLDNLVEHTAKRGRQSA
jgi:uncharacterized protein YndB with AHSA1/START domain